MFLIIGLGNPGSEYEHNRHNIGFMVADALVEKYGFSGPKNKFSAEVFDGQIGEHKMIAIKPQTYMNLSGGCVRQAMDFYKVSIEKIMVIHDELDLDPGVLRIKTGGGAAGHNGLRSIDAECGQGYKRLRFGIGHPGHKDLVSAFVLHDFDKSERQMVEEKCINIAAHFPLLLAGDESKFLNACSV